MNGPENALGDTLQPQSLVLNRFFVKQLSSQDLSVCSYQCQFATPPEPGKEQKALASVCYQLGLPAVRLDNTIITKTPIENTQGDGWHLTLGVTAYPLQPSLPAERQALESLERRLLEYHLRRIFWKTTEVSRASEGGLLWTVKGDAGLDHMGEGWAVQRGRRFDIHIDPKGQLFLDIDVHFRFQTPWTLEQWLERYPDCPVSYVRNTYRESDTNDYRTWRYLDSSDESPEQVQAGNVSLAEYHRRKGASERDITTSRVIYVKSVQRSPAQRLPHLSQRVSPSLTMDMLAQIPDATGEVASVFRAIRLKLSERLTEAQKAAQLIFERIYRLSTRAQPLSVSGFQLPAAQLLAAHNQPIKKVAQVRTKGCATVGELQFGCLNLFTAARRYPEAVRRCLDDIAKANQVELRLDSYRTSQDFPDGDLDQQIFWQTWAVEGIKTVLVVMERTTQARKQALRNQALQAGIATQFIVPLPKADQYKAMNVTLGLLCKAGWQPVHLKPFARPDVADLVIGFDTGTNRELYYGTSAFAVLANGQSLGWELPDVQRGETFSGAAIWQTVSKLVLKYHQICGTYPRKLLLMRDGLVQANEFEPTLANLGAKNIAVDVLSVRKSGAGRMGYLSGDAYRDAPLGSVFFEPEERSFILMTSQSVSAKLGSARPLRVVHAHGETPLEVLAIQTYHLAQLHPASGFSACRLPWVLHLADRSSKEFQRIQQMSILQVISREKLIAV